MLERHYAPLTKTFLTEDVSEEIKRHSGKRIGILTFKSNLKDDAITTQIILSEKGNMAEAASKLYDAMHELDHQNLDVIIAEKLPNFGLGKSINDRLKRATFSL